MRRRDFLGSAACALGSAMVGGRSANAADSSDPVQFDGVLVDLTRCNGCRKCEEACAETNGQEKPDIKDKSVFSSFRETDIHRLTTVNRFETSRGQVFVKKQCMHCSQPACAAACLVKAMEKQDNGPVTWNGRKCMGCRYCMVSCPFDSPKFEYHSANPRILKCVMCQDRIRDGRLPACVEGCPVEALLFGKRKTLMEVARARIYRNPGKYVPHIYGEHEVGGTGWLYLSPVPFEEVGFRTQLAGVPYPEFTADFLYSVPLVLTIWPALLFALSRARTDPAEKGERS